MYRIIQVFVNIKSIEISIYHILWESDICTKFHPNCFYFRFKRHMESTILNMKVLILFVSLLAPITQYCSNSITGSTKYLPSALLQKILNHQNGFNPIIVSQHYLKRNFNFHLFHTSETLNYWIGFNWKWLESDQ